LIQIKLIASEIGMELADIATTFCHENRQIVRTEELHSNWGAFSETHLTHRHTLTVGVDMLQTEEALWRTGHRIQLCWNQPKWNSWKIWLHSTGCPTRIRRSDAWSTMRVPTLIGKQKFLLNSAATIVDRR